MSYNTYLKQVQEDPENVAKLNKKLGTIDTLHDSQVKTVKDTYTQQIADSEADYEDAYRENAVQKKVNEFYIAEEMANMGLTDSGLNRTQITANQLSYANNKAKLDQKRQSMVDALTREMNAKVADVENSRLSYKQAAQDEWDADNKAVAQNLYSAKVNADAEVEKARYSYLTKQAELDAEAAKNVKLSKIGYGTLASSANGENDNVIYRDVDGNSVIMRAGSNPYTGTINKDIYTGVFSNGYQPDNINGNKLSKFKGTKNISKTTFNAIWRTDGAEQSVWEANGKYYVWVGPNNQYVEVEYNEAKNDWVWA